MALKRAGYFVAGWNRSPAAEQYALKNNIIDERAESFDAYDLVFVVLPPEAAADFITQRAFKEGAIVSDMCGIKGWIEKRVFEKERNFRYVGCHPMAGKEVSGIENACAALFEGASMIITKSEKTDDSALETVRSVAADMGFARIVECSAEIHDRKIAYTSQLAHIVSNAYVKNAEIDGCLCFTGGSFQDMTRIAGVDENIWASLYLLNAQNVLNDVKSIVSALEDIGHAVESGDADRLRKVLAGGRKLFSESKNICENKDISVKNLK